MIEAYIMKKGDFDLIKFDEKKIKKYPLEKKKEYYAKKEKEKENKINDE